MRSHFFALLVVFAAPPLLAQEKQEKQEPKPPAAAAAPDRAALEKQFEETLSNAVMKGSFTVTGRDDKKLSEEKYTLGKVSKLKDDFWLFNVRIQYGDKDATLPLPLEVKWAGDTPVITLTKMPIPGFGTFTARVVIYENHYAGFWSGGDHGGHLFGTIEKAKPAENAGK
jgi:hypothetical protein